jgi:hypothetical protein
MLGKTSAVLFLVCGLLSGCAELTWVRADTTAAQLESDQEGCRRQAFVSAKDRYDSDRWFQNSFRPGVVRSEADRAEADRHQREKSRIETERGLNERRAFVRCMEDRGYRQVERPAA